MLATSVTCRRRWTRLAARCSPTTTGAPPEFADWEGTGLYEGRDRPGWTAELAALSEVVASLPAARVLDLGCGTGFVTQKLHATSLIALDQSATEERMGGPGSMRIPNVCKALGLEAVVLLEMFRREGFRF